MLCNCDPSTHSSPFSVEMEVLSCRYGVHDAEWGQIRAMRVLGRTVSQIVKLCRCRSRCVVYDALSNHVRPSMRLRNCSPKKSLQQGIKKRRTKVKRMIAQTISITGTKILKLPGRPRKDGTPRGTYTKTQKMKKLKFPSPASVARELSACEGIEVSRQTVARDLAAVGMKCYSRQKSPQLSEQQCTTRVKFCRKQLRRPATFWDSLVFTDETWLDANDAGQRHQYCMKGKQRGALIPREYSQAAAKAFLWGAISTHFRLLVIVDLSESAGGGMTSQIYVDQCIAEVKKYWKNELTLMQDGATAHWSEATKPALIGMEVLRDWPANSCDLNPVEKIWSILKTAVANRGPYGVEELEAYVLDEFMKIDDDTIAKFVQSFKGLLKKCIAAKGQAVR